MAFGWLGTFRTGQWLAYRSFVLKERGDVSRRLRVIDAELARIGSVTVEYAMTTDPVTQRTTCSEERKAFYVSPNSSLEKLIRAYAAQGGNPFDISLYLEPDSVGLADESDPDSVIEFQPYGGVIYPKTGDPALNAPQWVGGNLNVVKYTPPRTGGKDAHDSVTGQAVDRTRRWVNQVIDERIHSLEARILKLCDLREQLLQERDMLEEMVGGTVVSLPNLDEGFYNSEISIAGLVATIDQIFFTPTTDNTGGTMLVRNADKLARFPQLMDDILPDEAHTIL
jgi:hypothetical protein